LDALTMAAQHPLAASAQAWANSTLAMADNVAQHMPALQELQDVHQTMQNVQQALAHQGSVLLQVPQTQVQKGGRLQRLEAGQGRQEVTLRAFLANSRAAHDLPPMEWLLNAQGQLPQAPPMTKGYIWFVALAPEVDAYMDHYGLQHAAMPIVEWKHPAATSGCYSIVAQVHGAPPCMHHTSITAVVGGI
jgi:hypothetical protein